MSNPNDLPDLFVHDGQEHRIITERVQSLDHGSGGAMSYDGLRGKK
ncbi:MAG: hypothetical protein WA432_03130 [Candidatus Babeliaceae bacterium]